jgi:fibro-slime domain-containing protein
VIELQPGASLHLYLMAGSSSWNHTDINVNTGDPGRVKVWNLSSVGFTIHNHARVYARIFSPDASLELTNHGALFGTFAGQTVNFGNHGDLHLDTAAPLDSCSSALADVAGTAGAGSSGGIVSAATFDQWFRDVLGTNFSMILPLKLLRNGEGVYEHLSDAFHPVDGLLFGNEGRPHNDWFTLALEVEFVYGACTGQFLEFEGSDDAWIFVDGVLAIDLGGVVPATSQLVEMDRLDLTDGAVHAVHLFYAHRGPSTPVFRLRTNVVPLAPPGGDTITVSATVD